MTKIYEYGFLVLLFILIILAIGLSPSKVEQRIFADSKDSNNKIVVIDKNEAEENSDSFSDTEDEISFEAENNGNKYPKTTIIKYRKTDNSIKKPTVGYPTIDPVYNTKISMINKSDKEIANYPKVQSWNKNMTLIKVGNRFYDAKTLNEAEITKKFISNDDAFSAICSPNSSDFRWSNKDSNKFYVLNTNRKFIGGEIIDDTTDCSTVLVDLSKYERVEFGPYSEGNIDNNDQYVIFVVKKYNDTNIYMILFDIKNKKIVWQDKKVENDEGVKDRWIRKNGSWAVEKLDWVSVSQSGKYIVMNSSNNNPMYRFDINLNHRVKLQYKDGRGNLISIGDHGDFGFDKNGDDVFVQNVMGQGGKINGVYMFNLKKPHELGKKILMSISGGHISGRNVDRPGWCYVTKQYKGYKDIFALKLDAEFPNTVEYFSQTHMKDDFYVDSKGNKHMYLETYGSPSPDGTKMIFNSHWDTNRIDTFVAEKL